MQLVAINPPLSDRPSFDVGPLDSLTIATPPATGLLSQTRSNPLIVVFTPLLAPRYT
jgi:hypothetical protein